eukprot:scaffold259698_cov27-Tisochrysis_lutea.AAC.3
MLGSIAEHVRSKAPCWAVWRSMCDLKYHTIGSRFDSLISQTSGCNPLRLSAELLRTVVSMAFMGMSATRVPTNFIRYI